MNMDWINVNYKLPRYNNDIIIVGADGIPVCGWFDPELHRFMEYEPTGSRHMKDITHWMPLPEYPKKIEKS